MDLQETKSITSFDTRSVSSGNQLQYFTNSKDNVKVVIRVRPLNEREKGNGGHKKCVTVENDSTVHIESKPDFKSFNFDFVGDENIEQEVIFNTIAKPIADGCMEGYNGTIFAYGQTGAGKTFTIQGPNLLINGEEQLYGLNKNEYKEEVEKRGIMQRSFEYIFESIEKQRQKIEGQDEAQFDFLVRCSYLEIYNEQIMDLLEPTSVNLHIREDIKKGVYVEGLQEEVVSSAKDMMEIIQTGTKNRHVGSTSMNKESSRSHSVLTTIIETKSMKLGGVWHIKTSRFHIIDLAGSERSKYTNTVGERLKEAGMINKSLSALGNVINSLVDISEGKSRHVHYRDSKLTFLLRDSLGGNSKTVIIANISPSSLCYGETLSTLKFAQRAKLIRNKAVINEDSSGTIQLLKAEIVRLQKELAENEKMYKQIDLPSNGQQCSTCKALIGSETQDEEDELLINNISICEDLDSSVLNTTQTAQVSEVLKQKLKNQKDDLLKMRKRIVHLEGLLTVNLDNMASQQKFYDNEILKHQQQNKKLQQAVESYEKQCARDKMIIKFREERISKLEFNTPVIKDDQIKMIADLKKEVQMWKESSEHNAQAAKLYAEKSDLSNKLEQLKAEYKQAPDSLSAQMRQLTELNESLNQYLKLYCEESKKEVENELSKVKLDYAEKIEHLNVKMNELKEKEAERKEKHKKQQQDLHDLLANYKEQIERITSEHLKERQELERTNQEQIEKIKSEIVMISENKTEQEQEIQLFKVQILEKEQQIAREKEQRFEAEKSYQVRQQEFTHELTELESKLNQLEESNKRLESKLRHNQESFEIQIDNERKNYASLTKQKEEEWQENIHELERKLMEESSDKQMLQEESDQLTDKIRGLEQENETIQESLLFKEEQIQEIQSEIKEKERLTLSLEVQIQELHNQEIEKDSAQFLQIQELETQIDLLKEENEALKKQLNSALIDKQDLLNAFNDIKQEISQLIIQRDELQQQIKHNLIRIESQSEKITNLESQIEQIDQDLYNRDNQIAELKLYIIELENQKSQLNEMLNDNILQQEENQKLVEKLQEDIKALQIQNHAQIEVIKQDTENQKLTLSLQMENKIKQLISQEKEKQREIDELNIVLNEKQEQIVQFESQIKEVNQKLQQKDIQIQELDNQKEQEIEHVQHLKEAEIQQKLQDIQKLEDLHNKSVDSQNQELSLRENIIQNLQSQIQTIKNEKILQIESVREQITNEKTIAISRLEQQFEIKILEITSQVRQEVINQKEAEKVAIIEQKEQQVQQIQQSLSEKIKQVIISKESEILQVQQQLSEIQSQRLEEALQIQEEKLNQVLKEKADLSLELNQKIQDLQRQIAQIKDQNILEASIIREEYERQIISKTQDILNFESERVQLKIFISQLEDRIEELSKQKELELEVITKTVQDEKMTIQQKLCQQLSLKEEEAARLTLQLDEQKQKFSLHQQQLQQLNLLLQDKESLFQTYDQKVESLTIQVAELLSQKSKIQELLQQQLSENQTLSRQIDSALLQNEQLQREQAHQQNDLYETLTSNKALQDQLTQQLNHKEAMQKELDNAKNLTKMLQQQVQEGQEAVQIIEGELRDQIKQLREQIEELERDRYELSSQVTQRDTVQNQFEQENQQLKEQIQEQFEQQNQLSNLNLKIEQQLFEVQEQIQSKDQQIQILQQDIKKHKLLLDDTIDQLNSDHVKKLQDQEQNYIQQHSQLKSDQEKYKQIAKDLNHHNQKLKQDNEEQNSMLKQCRDTISRMAQKENELMKELEKKINEFKDKHEKYKLRLDEQKEQMKQLKFELDKSRVEAENFKELIKLKDRQIEEQQNCDERDKQALENITKENKELRNQLTKREFELRDLVKRLKYYSEEKSRLEIELEKAHRENDELIGHKNPSQKIQHHVRIKEENNKLREENVKLQEELRKKVELLTKYQRSHGQEGNQAIINSHSQQELEIIMQSMKEDLSKYKKENQTYQETINRLVDHILSQPGLFKAIGLTQENSDKLMQQSGPVKVKKTMEIISMLSNIISQKEREVKDLEREVKQYECRLNIIEKEKIMYKQQVDIIQNNGMGYQHQPSVSSQTTLYNKRSPSSHTNQQQQQQQQQFVVMQNQNELQLQQQHQPQKPSRLFVEGFQDGVQIQQQPQSYQDYSGYIQNQTNQMNISSHQGMNANSQQHINKQSPSPIYNIRQQKEKENIQAKKDLFSQQRSGSGRRTTYLSGSNSQQQQNIMPK